MALLGKRLFALILCGAVSLSATCPPVFAQQDKVATYKQELMQDIEGMRKQTQVMVDMIYSFGELGFQEYETSKYVTEMLEKAGFKVERGVAGIPTAWVATWGEGKPTIGFIADLDGIPVSSQKPGVAYKAPLIEGAPGHGEGHNAGQAVNVTAVLALQKLMMKHKIPGQLKVYPGVAEELLGSKNYLVRAGAFKGVDLVLGAHISSDLSTGYGRANNGLVSTVFHFKGRTAHSAGAPWRGRSALDAVELMDIGWNFRREHLPLRQRSHSVVLSGGDQPNVVPDRASVWYYFREGDYPSIKALHELGQKMAKAAAMMTDTEVSEELLSATWQTNFSKVIAETQQKNIEMVGLPRWSEADQTLAKAVQVEIDAPVKTGLPTEIKKLEPPKGDSEFTGGGSDDIGEISWNLPTVYLRFPGNIPGLPGHNWVNGISMATPISHKGATAGAKAQALTALDFLMKPALVKAAWDEFYASTKDTKWVSLVPEGTKPPIWLNRERQEKYRPEMRKYYYDPSKYATYLDQLGIKYPTVRVRAAEQPATPKPAAATDGGTGGR
jgi:aminobenzoyl-glutamate utilization protein B